MMNRSTAQEIERDGLREKLALFKNAVLGGDSETSFEQAFATLAYTYIRDAAPRLLQYMIGFQLVERTEDNTKAVGIFGFKVGKTWLYAPVFFLNGELKGHQLLYLKDQDMFVPLKENWINYVLSKKPHVMGEPEPQQLRELGVLQPDIRQLSRPPQHSKYGSDRAGLPSGWKDWTEDWAPIYGALTTGRGAAALAKFAGLDSEELLKSVVRSHLGVCKTAMDVCESYPVIGRAFERLHGPNFFRDALLDLRKRASEPRQSASGVLDADRPSRLPTHVLGKSTRAAGPPVEIIIKDQLAITENVDLDDDEKEKIVRDGYLVRDYRTGEEVSKTYNTQIEMELTNPDASGLYEVLQKDGDFVKCVIFANPHGHKGREDFALAVRLDPKDWINAHRTTLFAKPNVSTAEDYKDWFDGLSGGDDMSKDGVYCIVSANGEGSCPFRVKEDMGDGRFGVHFMDYADRNRPNYLPAADNSCRDDGISDDCSTGYCDKEMVFLNDREGSCFRSMQGTLYIPEEHKIITLKKPEPPRKDEPTPIDAETSSEDTSFIPGDFADLQLQILQKTARCKIYTDGNEVSINGSTLMSKFAGLFHLIRNWHLREDEARQMLKDAERARLRGEPAFFRVKMARDPYAQTVGIGPGAPMIPDPNLSTDSTYGHLPAQYGEEWLEQVPGLGSDETDPDVYNPLPEATPDPMALQSAQQAGQMGQKEVFDTAMISSLLKSVRQESFVDRYIGDLLKAMDRLGRILFMFYWHNDEFIDRYGKSDAPELEDTLVNAFEVLGDLTHFLKEKDVAPLPGMELSEPEVDEATG